MLDHAREAVEMARGKTRADLDSNRQLNLALVRLLEIIGEAASRMPEDERARYPGIPCRRSAKQVCSTLASTTKSLSVHCCERTTNIGFMLFSRVRKIGKPVVGRINLDNADSPSLTRLM
jgi:hypothetical protein